MRTRAKSHGSAACPQLSLRRFSSLSKCHCVLLYSRCRCVRRSLHVGDSVALLGGALPRHRHTPSFSALTLPSPMRSRRAAHVCAQALRVVRLPPPVARAARRRQALQAVLATREAEGEGSVESTLPSRQLRAVAHPEHKTKQCREGPFLNWPHSPLFLEL